MSTPVLLEVWVPGRPVPQGSMQALQLPHQRHAMVQPSNKAKLLPWRNQVVAACSEVWAGRAPCPDPVIVTVEFSFHRPASHFGTGRNAGVPKASAPAHPGTRGQGDLDKLVRGVLDGMDAADVFADDSLVVELHARKQWGPTQGARIWMQEA